MELLGVCRTDHLILVPVNKADLFFLLVFVKVVDVRTNFEVIDVELRETLDPRPKQTI